MKKTVSLLLAGAMCAGLLAGCGSKPEETTAAADTTAAAAETTAAEKADAETTEAAAETKEIEKLSIAFVPSREPSEIITATAPLKEMLTKELAGLGYDVKNIDITVGTSYEAVGEALSAGTADVGLIPGGTYVLYDDGCDVLLTATRDGLSIDSDSAKDWNDQAPTEATENQVTSYRALIIAGPSEKGKAIAEKVNAGEELTWEDIDGLNWSVMGSSSPAGYIYPSLWLQENFEKNITDLSHAVQSDSYGSAFARLASGQIDVLCTAGYIYPSLWLQENFEKNITDLSHAVQSDSYGSAFARLASGQIDVLCTYADARRDYEDEWTGEYAMTNTIWDDTAVIGVTPAIYNDTISVSKTSPVMDDDFKAALSEAFINIGNTEEGKEVIAIYSHNGYQPAKAEDYDSERAAQKMIQEMNSAS